MARIVHCEAKLHKYDADVHSTCPWCKGGSAQPAPLVPPPPPDPDAVKTRPIWQNSMVPPVVGWLVVIDAPEAEGPQAGLSNRGRDYRLVPNRNTIGRHKDCDVALSYGDMEISDEHCAVVYDSINNTFFIQPGDGMNLTYILENPASESDGASWVPVLAVRELKSRDTIRLGKTLLSFVPFCWPGEFVWQFESAESDA